MLVGKGLIVIGYPGIGKTTAANELSNCVDLESSYFVNNLRYCELAMNIANQGNIVFVSSHKMVCEYFNRVPFLENVAKAIIICPRTTMKDEWIKKLEERYENSGLEKDWRALEFVRYNYTKSIVDLCSRYENLPVYQIEAMDYKLCDYIHYCRNQILNEFAG